MKLTYDPERNLAYIRFHEKPGQVTTIKISDDVTIDVAPEGTVYGLELLNANEQLTQDHGALIVESGGRSQEQIGTVPIFLICATPGAGRNL